jgi:hypothetical protein
MTFRFIFLWIMYAVLLLSIILGPTGIGAFVDPPSFLIVGGLTSLCLIFSFGLKKCARMTTSALLLKAGSDTEEERKSYIQVCDAGINAAMFSGGLGVLIGIIQMLQDLSDPNALGVGMATSLMTLFYSFCIGVMLFIPAKYYFINSLKNSDALNQAASRSTLFLPSFIFLPLGALLFLSLPFPHLMSEKEVTSKVSANYLTLNDLQSHIPGTQGKIHLYINLTFEVEGKYQNLLEIMKLKENVVRSKLIDEMLKYDIVAMEQDNFPSLLKEGFKRVLNQYFEKEFSIKSADEKKPVIALFFSKFLINDPMNNNSNRYYY